MKYAFEVGSSFIKIGLAIQQLIGVIHRQRGTQTHR
jgi:hypothetical protein